MDKKQIITNWFDEYGDDIYQFFVYRVGMKDVEDLVQEVFIRALHHYESFQGNATPKSWLYSIARNLAIDEIRKKSRDRWKIFFVGEERKMDGIETPDDLLTRSEVNKELYKAIHKLKPSYRDVIILRGLKELSIQETATILDWKEEKVRLTYHRAKQTLKEKLGGSIYE
ncbi:RNA polymerase sigma factor [Evansella sp. AB-rgal1]|uniref:RNA polymerase sigma factor n=1 Tax=Evansella sp. AB-rgal1 TaxID=3242696 RepID=UPI00359EC391